jgi:tetratricopeptide (TPR) repeat protein
MNIRRPSSAPTGKATRNRPLSTRAERIGQKKKTDCSSQDDSSRKYLRLSEALEPQQLGDHSQERWLRQQALAFARNKEYAKAIALFDQLIVTNPGNASHYNNRGLLFFQSGCVRRALSDYDQAIALNPRLSQPYNNRANCFAALGALEAAVVDYETALDLNPANLHARLNLGVTFREMGLYDIALDTLETVLHFSRFQDGTEPGKSRFQARVYGERGRVHHLAGDWNWAIADYQRSLEMLSQLDDTEAQKLIEQIQGWQGTLVSAA